ncbi:tRNA pseudouridine synthase [Quillaja saponaria]|uniref:tRNA pseudouridine synthase n=1 Tax=Quillaja saponaria TaxID=32244 RepID=A0AAD7Q2L1_QUISA|nr:tRNA pseudouridine synthase [Quillaja saponaria]
MIIITDRLVCLPKNLQNLHLRKSAKLASIGKRNPRNLHQHHYLLLPLMENLGEKEKHVHYNHTDPWRYARWDARESYQFMYSRPWQQVNDFYLNAVNGSLSLLALFGAKTFLDHNDPDIPEVSDNNELWSFASEHKSGRWARVTFKIILSYHGGSFDGWQKQPGLKTVQSVIEGSLGDFVDEKKAQLLKDKGFPVEGCVAVAGRTDKGVTALRQVCSFYTWRKDVKPRDVGGAINNAAPGSLKVISVSEVSRTFHPNFSAKWRRYLYIFPLTDKEYVDQNCENGDCFQSFRCNQKHDELQYGYADSNEDNIQNLTDNNKDDFETGKKPEKFSIRRVDQLLRRLEGKLLSYKLYARDTKASRNVGPPTECFVYHARAAEARLPITDHGEGRRVMCIELVANRFLRKMVRVLVATSIREAAAGAEGDALLKLMDATCRRATAPPAPADGLCLVDVGYGEFDPEKCLIRKE